jgi:hypothetical protein
MKYVTLNLPTRPSFTYDLLGLAGKMRSGKDTIADILVGEEYGFDKRRLAAVLYDLWSITSMTTGIGAKDRQLRLIHSTLNNFSNRAGTPVPYSQLVKLTKAMYQYGQELRASDLDEARRKFLQGTGFQPGGILGDCKYFPHTAVVAATLYTVRWSLMDQKKDLDAALDENPDAPLPPPSVVISDVRLPEEAEAIIGWGGSVYVLEPPEEVRLERVRDSGGCSEEALQHISEQGIPAIKEQGLCSGIITSIPAKGELPAEIKMWLRSRGRGVEDI